MMQPETALSGIQSHIKNQWMTCFSSAILFGLLAHGYKLTNFLPNWDSLLNLYASQDKTELGRCFLAAACLPSSCYDLPWVNGLLSLVYIAVSAVCVSELFQIRRKIPLVLMGGIMATFPTVTSTLAYNYTADGYFLALLCACAAVLLAVRCRKGLPLASLLLALSLGIYQAYITFAMVLMLIYLIDQLLFYEMEQKQFWRTAGKFLACGMGGALLYLLSLKIMLALTGKTLMEYQGIDKAFSLGEVRPLYSILRAGYRFLLYFFDFSHGINRFLVLNAGLVLLLAGLFLRALRAEKTARKIGRLLLILVCMAAIPFAAFALYFVNPILDYHNLMVMSLCLIYMLPIIFYERMPNLSASAAAASRWGIIGLSALTIYHFMLLANISYQKLQMSYERSYGVIVRLAERIGQLPEAGSCRKIAVLGCLEGSEAISYDFPPDMTGITDSYIIRKQDTAMQENVTQAMLSDYCGIFYHDTTEEEVDEIRRTEAYKEMGCWPEAGAVAVIGDTLVVKFGEENDE